MVQRIASRRSLARTRAKNSFAAVKPRALVAANVLEHVKIELTDVARLLKRGNELGRRNDASLVEPSAERLASDEHSGINIDLGLGERPELLVCERI